MGCLIIPCQARRLILLNLPKSSRHFSCNRSQADLFPGTVKITPALAEFGFQKRLLGSQAVRCVASSVSSSAATAADRRPRKDKPGGTEKSEKFVIPVGRPGPQGDSFLADKDVTWESLNLSKNVAEALTRAKFLRPSLVQASTIPVILGGKDVIVAAETGSGKTHAYLAPIFDLMLKKREESDEATEAFVTRRFSLVLCPNATLCQQVVDMANMLQNDKGLPMLDVVPICGGQGWPVRPPDVVVATPAAVLNHLFAYDPRRRRRKAFVRDACCVIFDEADMLISGGFARDLDQLIGLFREEERRLAKLYQFGPEIAQGSFEPWTQFPAQEENVDEEDISEDERGEPCISEEEAEPSSTTPQATEDQSSANAGTRIYWQSRKRYKRSKQYIFVAATLPDNGKRTPGALLKRIFPEAVWIQGSLLHCHSPRIQHRWIEVSDETRISALLEAISEGSGDGDSSTKRTMVFANSVDAVDAVSRILSKAGIKSLVYHREVPVEERNGILSLFQHEGGLLLCTDSAARGIDIPDINHIIQAEFASSVVDFLHRVGRTGRAGRFGVATNFYTKANRPLVEAVQKALTEKQTVEGAFSRKRSFRNKLKKYGSERREQDRRDCFTVSDAWKCS
ncbi:hypothetical protein R1sor_000865 [Riccia sorocarpa]|uniref:DEAD-box ATP-dependent RNA helicase 22 n=1 Tax=Riccia sorocarpa TaxID=122646 RepID=A0ABD3GUN2_9MARC